MGAQLGERTAIGLGRRGVRVYAVRFPPVRRARCGHVPWPCVLFLPHNAA